MNRQTKAGAVNTGSNQKLIYAGGISKASGFFDYAENTTKLQADCDLCHPNLQTKSRGAAKLCSGCTANGERIASGLFEHLKQNRKVIRLQKCFACNGCFAPSKFSQVFGICKICLSNRDEPAAARRKFAARAINNLSKLLRGALAL